MMENAFLTGPGWGMTSPHQLEKVVSTSLNSWKSGSMKFILIVRALITDDENMLQTSIGWGVWPPGRC